MKRGERVNLRAGVGVSDDMNKSLPSMQWLQAFEATAHNVHRLSGCFSYYLIIPKRHLQRRDIQALRHWMRELFTAAGKQRPFAPAA